VKAARSSGLLSIESSIDQASDPFLKECLMLTIDIRERSELQIYKNRLRETQGEADAKALEVAGGFAPKIGVIRTVVGLTDCCDSSRNCGRLDRLRTRSREFCSVARRASDSGPRRREIRNSRVDRRRLVVSLRPDSSRAGAGTAPRFPPGIEVGMKPKYFGGRGPAAGSLDDQLCGRADHSVDLLHADPQPALQEQLGIVRGLQSPAAELLSGNYAIPESRLAVVSDGSFARRTPTILRMAGRTTGAWNS